MTNEQHNRFDMMQSVQHYLDNNLIIINTNVTVMAVKTLLDEKIEELMAHLGIQLTKTKGIAENKQIKRAALITKTLSLSNAICAYANIADNSILYKENHCTKSSLNLMNDFNLSGNCAYLAISLENNLSSLLPFGVDANKLNDYKNAIEVYTELINKPKESISKRNESTRAIAKLLSEISTLLKERLDNLIGIFEDEHSNFVGVYRSLRRVGKAPTRQLDLVVKTISTTTQQPIEKAMLKIKNKKGFRLSSKMGRNLYSNLKQGQHQLVVTHPNYKPKTIDFIIVDKETTTIIVALEENEIGTQLTQI